MNKITNTLLPSFFDLLNRKHVVKDNSYHIDKAIGWINRAQDRNKDGGVSSWYSLVHGWDFSFIETTGYILETYLNYYHYSKQKDLLKRAIKMADFIVAMQLPNGGYRTYPPEKMTESEPTVFNTAQDLIGMCDIYEETKEKKYLNSLNKAAEFLCEIQNQDGSWTTFEYGGEGRTYETRAAWALLKAYELTKKSEYLKSAKKQLEWASSYQLKNGWFEKAELPAPNPPYPYTHTISYVMEGFLYSGLLLKDKKWIAIAQKAADALLLYYEKNGKMAGMFDKKWEGMGNFSCLTGNAQIVCVWLELYQITKDTKYLKNAKKLNYYLKSTQDTVTANLDINGGIKGSDPIYGDLKKRLGYCRLAYPNWAVKFFIDSLLKEILYDKN